jgi:hypothetical protein
MAFLCNPNPEPVAPPSPSRFRERLEERHKRTEARIKVLAGKDVDEPTGEPQRAEEARAGTHYAEVYAAQHRAAVQFETMTDAAARSVEAHEAVVRAALERGEVPPATENADVVAKVLADTEAGLAASWPDLEAAAAAYVGAAESSAASRAASVCRRLRPIVESYQPTIRALAEAEARAAGR